jgi:hypothetical protein
MRGYGNGLQDKPAGKPGTSEMIMNALLTDNTTAEPSWAGLHPSRTGLLKTAQKILSALLAHHLRKAEAELMALDDRLLEDTGLDGSENGPVLTVDAGATIRVRKKRPQGRVGGA